jgi:hypothetical protein
MMGLFSEQHHAAAACDLAERTCPNWHLLHTDIAFCRIRTKDVKSPASSASTEESDTEIECVPG